MLCLRYTAKSEHPRLTLTKVHKRRESSAEEIIHGEHISGSHIKVNSFPFDEIMNM